MGNRAVITTEENFKNNGIGVYVHWNGGRDSIEAFLEYCKRQGYRPPEDDCYGWAYLVTTLGNFFGSGLSLGVDVVNRLDCDNYDNGVYFIENWEIVGRKYFENGVEQDEYDLEEMVNAIDEKQPENMRLKKEND